MPWLALPWSDELPPAWGRHEDDRETESICLSLAFACSPSAVLWSRFDWNPTNFLTFYLFFICVLLHSCTVAKPQDIYSIYIKSSIYQKKYNTLSPAMFSSCHSDRILVFAFCFLVHFCVLRLFSFGRGQGGQMCLGFNFQLKKMSRSSRSIWRVFRCYPSLRLLGRQLDPTYACFWEDSGHMCRPCVAPLQLLVKGKRQTNNLLKRSLWQRAH